MTVTTFSFTTGATVSSWTVPNHTGLVTITAIGGGGGGRVPGAVGGACAGGGGNIRRSQRPRHCLYNNGVEIGTGTVGAPPSVSTTEVGRKTHCGAR